MNKQIKERGIIFNGEMVMAILSGRKTQTRRIISPQPPEGWGGTSSVVALAGHCPFGQVGDRLWVKETFGFSIRSVGGSPHKQLVFRASRPDAVHYYDCNGVPSPMKWSPSSRMPREYSRITLEITDIRVERLRCMSEDDARAEGVIAASGPLEAGLAFREIWDSIYGQDSWQSNPFVWVVEFKRVEAAC